ncbi:nucleotidyltransferase family protein, partial [Xanthomonas hortorum]
GIRPLQTLSDHSNVISSWAAVNPEIHRAWIFGSYATGKARPDSDLDVAIDIVPEATCKYGIVAFWFDHHTRLEKQLQQCVGSVKVQLEMYHRYHGSIVYRAINSAGISPVYRRSAGQRPNNSFKPKPLRGAA